MALQEIPSFFVLQRPHNYGGPYLRLLENPPAANMPSGLMSVDESQIWSPRVKFAAEQSERGDGAVHIRSCYNNKYWVAHEHQGRFWMAASADSPEEDRTNPACTLFHTAPGRPGFQLVSIATSMRVSSYDGVLGLSSLSGLNFAAVDWSTLVILPSRVSIRSEELDGQFLCSRVIDRHYNYHRFESGMGIGDPVVAHELYPMDNGLYRIKNLHFGKFWRLGSRWIWADAEENNDNNEAKFEFVKINDKVIAIRNLGNNLFCAPDSREGKVNCLRAEYPTITARTRLMVEERVLKREITNIRYRLSDARVYKEEVQDISELISRNSHPTNDAFDTLQFTKSDSTATFWSNSVSLNFSVVTQLKFTPIPVILEGTVTTKLEVGYEFEWREERTTVNTTLVSHTVRVPPLSAVKIMFMCTKGACDVPFSYTQRDLLTNGQWVSTTKDDGLYTGNNTYSFRFHSFPVDYDEVIKEEQINV